jgi:hypothetical protein
MWKWIDGECVAQVGCIPGPAGNRIEDSDRSAPGWSSRRSYFLADRPVLDEVVAICVDGVPQDHSCVVPDEKVPISYLGQMRP